MTGQEMQTYFQGLVDDDFDTTQTYQILSYIKNWVERKYKLEICKKLDSSNAANVGDTYTTLKSLPTDFRTLIKIFIDRLEYFSCKFEDQVLYRNVARRVFLDMRQNKFAPTGPVGSTGTWNIFYIYKTTDFTEDNEDTEVCVWPEEFQPLIPTLAAKIFQGNIDGDALSFQMSGQQEIEAERILEGLILWDADLKLSAMGNATGFDPSTQEDLGFDLGRL